MTPSLNPIELEVPAGARPIIDATRASCAEMARAAVSSLRMFFTTLA